MSQTATITQVQRALAGKHAKNNTASGIDGCPYELWKTLNQRNIEKPERNQAIFDVIRTLTTVFQDIQTHAVDERTNFALGWMCIIFKEKDRSKISNYRPITLLNTDISYSRKSWRNYREIVRGFLQQKPSPASEASEHETS